MRHAMFSASDIEKLLRKDDLEKLLKDEIEVACDHEGRVLKGVCERCGEDDLESDFEIYRNEAPL